VYARNENPAITYKMLIAYFIIFLVFYEFYISSRKVYISIIVKIARHQTEQVGIVVMFNAYIQWGESVRLFVRITIIFWEVYSVSLLRWAGHYENLTLLGLSGDTVILCTCT
jgi:hypothetical protein